MNDLPKSDGPPDSDRPADSDRPLDPDRRPHPDRLPAEGPGSSDDGTTATNQRPIDRSLPPDPEAYDSPRASLARARGLSAPYIPGGHDPDPEAGRREERRYGRLLLAMVVVIVLSGFVLGIIANALTAMQGA